MTRPYFRQIPNLDYVSRLPDARISDYIQVKNFFRKAKIRDDIFENLSYFEKYQIIGNDRPDNVAHDIYRDSTLDWVVLLANNIINIQTEWPMKQQDYDAFLLEKYGDYDALYNGIHHYETIQVINTAGVTIVPAGLNVSEDYSVEYYDSDDERMVFANNITVPITNYEYEDKLENEKRSIFILKPDYLHLIFDDIESIMSYKKGSSQYVTGTLKKGDNIRLYS
jgi:hypothetical protein